MPSWYSTLKNPVGGYFFKDQAVTLSRAGRKVEVLFAPQLTPLWKLHEVRKLSDFFTKRPFEVRHLWCRGEMWPGGLSRLARLFWAARRSLLFKTLAPFDLGCKPYWSSDASSTAKSPIAVTVCLIISLLSSG